MTENEDCYRYPLTRWSLLPKRTTAITEVRKDGTQVPTNSSVFTLQNYLFIPTIEIAYNGCWLDLTIFLTAQKYVQKYVLTERKYGIVSLLLARLTRD